jgi:hypothetical protein
MGGLTRNDQFRESGRWIGFADERPIGKKQQKYLRGSSYDASVRDMATQDPSPGIGHAHVKVGSVARDRSGQSQDFEITAQGVRVAHSGKPQSRPIEATDDRDYKRGAVRARRNFCLKGRAQVSAGLQSQRESFHVMPPDEMRFMEGLAQFGRLTRYIVLLGNDSSALPEDADTVTAIATSGLPEPDVCSGKA